MSHRFCKYKMRAPYSSAVWASYHTYILTYTLEINSVAPPYLSLPPSRYTRFTRGFLYLFSVFTMSNININELHPVNPVLAKEVNTPKEKGQTRVLPDGSLLYLEPLTATEGKLPH